MTNFEVRIIKFHTSLEIRRKILWTTQYWALEQCIPTVEQFRTTGG